MTKEAAVAVAEPQYAAGSIEALQAAVDGLVDPTMKAHALALVEKFDFQIEGVEDNERGFTPEWLRLIQGITDAETYPDSARAGDFVLGKGKDAPVLTRPAQIIPVMVYPTRSFWDPVDKDSGKVLCFSPDGIQGRFGACKTCQHAVFDKETSHMDCTPSYNILAVTADLEHVFTLGFSKTSWRVASDLVKQFTKKGRSPYQTICLLDSKSNEKYKQAKNPVITISGFTSPDVQVFTRAVFQYAKAGRDEMIKAFREGLGGGEGTSYEALGHSSEGRAAIAAPVGEAAEYVI